MEHTKYLIGDVANLMGLSRDTLRYYEKRGILSSEKGVNGYRYYTDKEISRLVSILYQRKMNVSLEDMETLWSSDDTITSLTGIMEERLKEEELAIRRHRQTIARLRLTGSDCKRICAHLGQVAVKDSPASYAIVPHISREESLGTWFRLAKEYPGLDMMYLFDEYTYQKDGDALELHYRNTQLILYKNLKEFVDYEIPPETPLTEPVPCLCSYRTSRDGLPRTADILEMLAEAERRGLALSDRVYSTYAVQGLDEGQHTYYLKIYIPLR